MTMPPSLAFQRWQHARTTDLLQGVHGGVAVLDDDRGAIQLSQRRRFRLPVTPGHLVGHKICGPPNRSGSRRPATASSPAWRDSAWGYNLGKAVRVGLLGIDDDAQLHDTLSPGRGQARRAGLRRVLGDCKNTIRRPRALVNPIVGRCSRDRSATTSIDALRPAQAQKATR